MSEVRKSALGMHPCTIIIIIEREMVKQPILCILKVIIFRMEYMIFRIRSLYVTSRGERVPQSIEIPHS